MLDGMPEMAEQVLGLPVRRGAPQGVGGLIDVVKSPVYATGVGLVKYGAEQLNKSRQVGETPYRAPKTEPASGDRPGIEPRIGETQIGNALDRVLSALGPAPVDIDELARATALEIQTVRGALLELSLAGMIEHHGRQLVSLKSYS